MLGHKNVEEVYEAATQLAKDHAEGLAKVANPDYLLGSAPFELAQFSIKALQRFATLGSEGSQGLFLTILGREFFCRILTCF